MTRTYPLPRPGAGETDPRFTYGLTYELTEVLKKHGYPELTSADFVELQLALFTFIYGPAARAEESR